MPKIEFEVPALILKDKESITLYFDAHTQHSGKEKIKYAVHIRNQPDGVQISLADNIPISIVRLDKGE